MIIIHKLSIKQAHKQQGVERTISSSLALYTAAGEADDLLLSNIRHQDLLTIGITVSPVKNRRVVCFQPVQQIYNALN